MARRERKMRDHCDLCREIREGCEAECAAADAGTLGKCRVCGNTGLIDGGDGTAFVCDSCPRGFRMKLWLRHEELAGRDVKEFQFA